jgi:hypothetical protein
MKGAEAPLELVTIDDRAQALARGRLVSRQQAEVGRPVPRPTAFGVAGTHEQPIRPGVKARRIAKLRKVSPDGQQCLLRGIFGEIGVAQDSVRHRVQSVANGHGQTREGLLVSVLRPTHQIDIHIPPAGVRLAGRHTVWAVRTTARLIFPV